jgi:hypothetical protein
MDIEDTQSVATVSLTAEEITDALRTDSEESVDYDERELDLHSHILPHCGECPVRRANELLIQCHKNKKKVREILQKMEHDKQIAAFPSWADVSKDFRKPKRYTRKKWKAFQRRMNRKRRQESIWIRGVVAATFSLSTCCFRDKEPKDIIDNVFWAHLALRELSAEQKRKQCINIIRLLPTKTLVVMNKSCCRKCFGEFYKTKVILFT